ncbi:hypothetical protein F4861DRAFT_535994 [Xylaria intraflava]|nr:hypothetical protein F4861DRAFT_535994 [Xylaria intraflava]
MASATQAPVGTAVGELWRNMGGQVDIGVETTLLGLAYISLGLRLWSRSIQGAQWQINDWLIVVATVLMTARYSIELVLVLKCGLGLPMDDVVRVGGSGVIVLFLKLLYALDLLWVTVVASVKMSILHFYSVIFRQRIFLRFVYAAMVIMVAFYIGAFLGTALVCIPPQKKWYPDTPGYCGSEITLYFAIVITDMLTDLIIIILPLPILWGLQLPLSKRLALSFIFGIGFGIVTITSVRIKFFLSLDMSNITGTIWQAGVLSAIVPLLGLVNASLPVMQPALRKIFGSIAVLATVKASATTSSGTRNFERIPESGLELSSMKRKSAKQQPDLGRIRVTTDWEVNSSKSDPPIEGRQAGHNTGVYVRSIP